MIIGVFDLTLGTLTGISSKHAENLAEILTIANPRVNVNNKVLNRECCIFISKRCDEK